MSNKIYVWDLLVRIFHWSLVLFFLVCYLTGEELDLIHAYTGYIILALVAFRIVWGLTGTRHARFSDFICSPAKTITYLKTLVTGKVKKHIGHNPLGGWMVVALLSSLLLTGWSGLKIYGIEGYGPLASPNPVAATSLTQEAHDDDDSKTYKHEIDKETEEFWEEIHEFMANFTVLLVLLHVAGVIFSSIKENQNLIRAMITGYKEKD